MFRLLAPNSQGIRQALLRNVSKNHTGLKLAGQNGPVDLQKDYQIRNNSTVTLNNTKNNNKKDTTTSFVRHEKKQIFADKYPGADASTFDQILRSARQHKNYRSSLNASLTEDIRSLSDLFKDESVKKDLSLVNIGQYASLLNDAVFRNRFSRLTNNSDRDSDSYNNSSAVNDVMLKEAILNLMDNVSSGQIRGVIHPETVKNLLLSMCQYKAWPEIVQFWENGVNDKNLSKLFLNEKILAAVLPVAYDEQRYTYQQIINLFETNTKDKDRIENELHVSIGKIAIKNKDYARALDSMEALLRLLEENTGNTKILKSLSELHLSFIGFSEDLKISTHFFNKVIEKDLPYSVPLKAPHVAALLDKLMASQTDFKTIFGIWKNTAAFYAKDKFQQSAINSRYSILNNKFLSIFFQLHPELTEESHNELRNIIAEYAKIKDVDEYFLNTLISNYNWGDKTVFLQLMELYPIHNIEYTTVSNRIVLKKMGEIADFTNADIINRWNRSLARLDQDKYRYIPIADWAALRDCTILSPYSEQRTPVYLALLNTYKDFHQDGRAVSRFAKTWLHSPLFSTVARVTQEPKTDFSCGEEIIIPKFNYLRRNVNYRDLSRDLFPKKELI